MHKLLASTYKEFLLVTRDIGGLAVLFLMPLLLVITITTIQDGTFKTLEALKMPLLVVDNDQGKVSQSIFDSFNASDQFEVVRNNDENEVQKLVQKGDYQLAIVIPANLSRDLQLKVEENVAGIIAKFGMEEDTLPLATAKLETKEVKLYFDPAAQQAFRISVKSNIDKMISKIESQTIYEAFQEQLTEDETEEIFDTESFINFREIDPNNNQRTIIPNSTQHNIPAWTLFAIFFIILPLGVNMVNEKNQGTFVRLRSQPVSYATVLGGKTLVFLVVSLIQFALMLLVGVYLFPLIGLPTLEITGKLPLLFIVAFFSGLAAIGLGLLLGTIAKTQEQSAPFAATFVVILAAIGGVWVPVFAMPGLMRTLSNLSPMNWALNAFYDVFLRDVGFLEIVPEITWLFVFFVITTLIAIGINHRKNAV